MRSAFIKTIRQAQRFYAAPACRLIAAAGGRVRFVLLDNDRDELLRRLSDRPGHYMPPSLLDSQLDTLERPTSDEPVLTLRSSEAPAVLCAETVSWLVSA